MRESYAPMAQSGETVIIQTYDPEEAARGIFDHLHGLVEGNESNFASRYFVLEDPQHVETERLLLMKLDVDPDTIPRSEEKQIIKSFGNICLTAWSHFTDDGVPYDVYYEAELLQPQTAQS